MNDKALILTDLHCWRIEIVSAGFISVQFSIISAFTSRSTHALHSLTNRINEGKSFRGKSASMILKS